MTVVFENDRVRVSRQTHADHGTPTTASRLDRLVVWLRDGHVHRKQDGRHEVLHRKRGDVVWRDASQHTVTPHSDGHEVLIVEFKDTSGIMRDGKPVPIEDVLAALNQWYDV